MTSYAPYTSQTLPLNLGTLEYCKIGNYADEFVIPSGKNKFNYADTFQDGLTVFSVAKIEPNKTYYCKAYNINDTYTGAFSVRTKLDGVWTAQNAVYLTQGFSFTAPSNCTGIAFNGCTNPSDRVCQVEEGSVATSYEPYNDGKWYLKKNIGKVVLNGSESWTYTSTNTDGVVRMATTNLRGMTNISSSYCNYYISRTGVQTFTKNVGLSIATNGTVEIYDENYNTSVSVADYKTWLNSHNLVLYYILQAPEYILLNDTLQSQLTEIYKWLKSYQDQTNISQVNNDLPFVIKASAVRDMSNIFDLISGTEL